MANEIIYFDSYESAAAGLLTVLLDARKTKKKYSFGGLSATTVFNSGLHLDGDIEDVLVKVKNLPGSLMEES